MSGSTAKELDEIALSWANGKSVRDVLWDAYSVGYQDGLDDMCETYERNA